MKANECFQVCILTSENKESYIGATNLILFLLNLIQAKNVTTNIYIYCRIYMAISVEYIALPTLTFMIDSS